MIFTLLKNRFIKIFSFLSVAILIILIILFPDVSSAGVSRGLVISANVIIPSLFPYMVCVLMFIKSGFYIKNRYFNKMIFVLFGHNFDMFFVFLLSMLGGYPVGAKLINQLYSQKNIDKKSADIMLMYCVNAGPAFIISAIGGGVFLSYKAGCVLLVSHIMSSLIIAMFFAPKLKKYTNNKAKIVLSDKSISENFVISVSDASTSIIQICSFVILFSAINAYIEYLFGNIPIIKNIAFLTEVTSAVTKTNNIFLVSFLLGFAGISIWCQIFTICAKCKVNFTLFAVGRILHGILSSALTYLIIKIFKITVSVFNNGTFFEKQSIYSDISISISLFVMLIVLMIFIYSKNCSRKILDDVV